MTERSGVLKGLKDQECERGSRTKRPPIPYVPVVDEVQDALNANSKEARTQKIKLPNKTEFQATIWNTGTPEEFVNHVKQALHACERMGLFADYDAALKARKKADKKLLEVQRQLEAAQKEPDINSAIVNDLKVEKKSHRSEVNAQEQKRVDAAEGFFSLYANLLSVEARTHWDKIVERQIDTAPWTDLKGKEKKKKRGKTYASFMDCTQHHLLTVFNYDAAEQQKFYISNILKKPQRVSVRAFFTRVEQLNSYIALLPSLYNSPRATPATKEIHPHDEAELAGLLLRMCPESWQTQYDLSQETIPQDSRKLLIVLENIEKVVPSSTAATTKPNTTNAGSSKLNGKSDAGGKRKGTDSSASGTAKKKRTEKHCVLCQKYGGKAATHNTSDCTKYEKDGTLQKAWAGNKYAADKTNKKSEGNSFAQLEKRLVQSFEKAIKKGARKASSRKRRHNHSDSSDSDSE